MKNKRNILLSFTNLITFNLRIWRKLCLWVSTCFCTILYRFLFCVCNYKLCNMRSDLLENFPMQAVIDIDSQNRSATSTYKRTKPRAMVNTPTKVMDKCIVYCLNTANTRNKFLCHQANAEYVNTHLIIIFIYFLLMVTDRLDVPDQLLTKTNGQTRIHEPLLSNDLKEFRFRSGRWKIRNI